MHSRVSVASTDRLAQQVIKDLWDQHHTNYYAY